MFARVSVVRDIMLSLFFLLFIILIFGTMIWAGFSAAPWLPIWKKDINQVLELAQIKSGEVVYDLGSGDGRLILAVAKMTPAKRVVGFEISLLFYLWSRIKILFSNYPQIQIKYQNFFKADFSQADVILCFLTPYAMRKLKVKLFREMKPGARLVSYAFTLPKVNAEKSFKVSQKSIPIYLYKF